MKKISIKERIASTNGWQRLWLVVAMGISVYFVGVVPIQQVNETNIFRYKEKWAIEEEMKNPACKEYMIKPFDQLEYSADTCLYIYFERKHGENDTPLTPETYEEKFNDAQREQWLIHIQIGLIVAVALSALLYAAGAVVAWVVRGFKR